MPQAAADNKPSPTDATHLDAGARNGLLELAVMQLSELFTFLLAEGIGPS